VTNLTSRGEYWRGTRPASRNGQTTQSSARAAPISTWTCRGRAGPTGHVRRSSTSLTLLAWVST